MDKIKSEEINTHIDIGSNQSEQYKVMIENLKEKLIHTVREN